MNDVGMIYLEVEDDIEYVKVCSPENQVILKLVFDINDKSAILYILTNFIQNYVTETYPNQTIGFEFSDEWRRIFAGVGEIRVMEVESKNSIMLKLLLFLMLGYDLINWIF